MSRPRQSSRAARGQLRIIGGAWRGRRLEVAAIEGLRPTPDRVRETLFNWLQPVIEGARCLDLFCGSGALGLEALSRGAADVVFVDRAQAAVAQLRESLQRLGATGAEAHAAEALDWIAHAPQAHFDVVFIDPPYRQGLAGVCAARLEARGLLAPHALVYLETAADEPAPQVPACWRLHRERRAGQVAYRLYAREDG
jgi:16S rRNA (guanine966-N2)-methyltransferase